MFLSIDAQVRRHYVFLFEFHNLVRAATLTFSAELGNARLDPEQDLCVVRKNIG